ncbi:hypothetical protein SUBVAR_05462 [Subdoligranulum variabile DSM 15176]|uniref:Uncharacterized protein n=1 Tax=Subdoligranulum variabile DSM 15176 TaxID=411471 RepID=D1PMA3_9FIRM|nr:hypothetical protein SUBVAR_05462 [Subdoligranulum variabile DSM 15176]
MFFQSLPYLYGKASDRWLGKWEEYGPYNREYPARKGRKMPCIKIAF